jgi:hypothetical protein
MRVHINTDQKRRSARDLNPDQDPQIQNMIMKNPRNIRSQRRRRGMFHDRDPSQVNLRRMLERYGRKEVAKSHHVDLLLLNLHQIREIEEREKREKREKLEKRDIIRQVILAKVNWNGKEIFCYRSLTLNKWEEMNTWPRVNGEKDFFSYKNSISSGVEAHVK